MIDELFYYRQHHGVVKGMLEMPKKDCKVLDIGGNIGIYKDTLKDSDYYVADIIENALEKAKENKCNPVKTDLNRLPLPFKDSSFDVIICTEVFEHIFYPDSLLKEIDRLLKKDGYAIFSIPLSFSVAKIIEFTKDFFRQKEFCFKDYMGQHVQEFSLKGATKSVSSTFSITKRMFTPIQTFRFFGFMGNGFFNSITNTYPSLFAESVIFKVDKKSWGI